MLKRLVLSNLKGTDYTAHVRVKKVEKAGDAGIYQMFRITVDVVELFNGRAQKILEYGVSQEKPTKGPAVGSEFIVSLETKKKDGRLMYFIPDNGYTLPVKPELLEALRSSIGK